MSIEHNHQGNCCDGYAGTCEFCEEHNQWRGECTRCPPCAACDLEWDDDAEAENAALYRQEIEEAGQLRLLNPCGNDDE